jgi:hypothetical protein
MASEEPVEGKGIKGTKGEEVQQYQGVKEADHKVEHWRRQGESHPKYIASEVPGRRKCIRDAREDVMNPLASYQSAQL